MKRNEKNKKVDKPAPKPCICGSMPVTVKSRAGRMLTCPNPCGCEGGLSTMWRKGEEEAVNEWNTVVGSYRRVNRCGTT